MKTRFLILIAMAVAASGCGRDTYTINGKAEGLKSDSVVLVNSAGDIVAAVALPEDGIIRLEGQVVRPDVHYLVARRDYLRLPVYLEAADYSIEPKGDGFLVSGPAGSWQAGLNDYYKGVRILDSQNHALGMAYSDADMEGKVAIAEKMDSLMALRHDRLLEGIAEFNGTTLAYHLAADNLMLLEYNFNDFTRVIELLDSNQTVSPLRDKVYESYAKMK